MKKLFLFIFCIILFCTNQSFANKCLDEDGLLGPKTDVARDSKLDIAKRFGLNDKTKYPKQSSGNYKKDSKVLEFQKAYNQSIPECKKNETKGYSLNKALDDLNITKKPEHLVGIDDEFENLEGDETDITRFIQKIINGITAIITTIAIVVIVVNAIKLVVSAGDNDTISKAKKDFTWGVVGLGVIVFAYVIVKTVIRLTYSGETQNKNIVVETDPEPPKIEKEKKCDIRCMPIPSKCFTSGATNDNELGQAQQSRVYNLDCFGDTKFPKIILQVFDTYDPKTVQKLLKDKGMYAGLPDSCSKIDGLYGECTQHALQKYQEKEKANSESYDYNCFCKKQENAAE